MLKWHLMMEVPFYGLTWNSFQHFPTVHEILKENWTLEFGMPSFHPPISIRHFTQFHPIGSSVLSPNRCALAISFPATVVPLFIREILNDFLQSRRILSNMINLWWNNNDSVIILKYTWKFSFWSTHICVHWMPLGVFSTGLAPGR